MALVGMGAVVGAATGGPLTGIVMIFEMTRDYAVIVPLVIAVAIAVGVRQALVDDTIYTIKLRHRGHRIPQDRQVELFLVQSARAIMATDFVTLPAGLPLETALQRMAERGCRFAILAEGRRIRGFVGPASDTLQAYLRDRTQTVGAVARRDFQIAQPDDLVENVIARLKRRDRAVALVVGGHGIPRVEDVVGVVSKTALAEAVIRGHPG
jgi:CIC family chloride channel protein